MSKRFRRILNLVLLGVGCFLLLLWFTTRTSSTEDDAPQTVNVKQKSAQEDTPPAPDADNAPSEAEEAHHDAAPEVPTDTQEHADAIPKGELDPVLSFDFHPDTFDFERWSEMLLSLEETMTTQLGAVGERYKDVNMHALREDGEATAREYVNALCQKGKLSDRGCEGIFRCVSDGVYNFQEDQALSEATGECYIDLRMRGQDFLDDQGSENFFLDP